MQESLFECDLDTGTFRTLRDRLRRLVRTGNRIRCYPLCLDCASLVIDASGTPRETPETVFVV